MPPVLHFQTSQADESWAASGHVSPAPYSSFTLRHVPTTSTQQGRLSWCPPWLKHLREHICQQRRTAGTKPSSITPPSVSATAMCIALPQGQAPALWHGGHLMLPPEEKMAAEVADAFIPACLRPQHDSTTLSPF